MAKRKLTECRNILRSSGCVCSDDSGWTELANLCGIKTNDFGAARKRVRAIATVIKQNLTQAIK